MSQDSDSASCWLMMLWVVTMYQTHTSLSSSLPAPTLPMRGGEIVLSLPPSLRVLWRRQGTHASSTAVIIFECKGPSVEDNRLQSALI